MKIVNYQNLNNRFFEFKDIEEFAYLRDILEDVQKKGDIAVRKYSLEFDHVDLDQFVIEKSAIKAAYKKLKTYEIDALQKAAENIKTFASRQMEQFKDFELEIQPGVFTGQRVIPIHRIGVYTPGGNFPLPSTLLMCALPAKIAGVPEIAMCTPPTYKKGNVHPAILVAADICKIDEIFKIGGVQAIAAMTYGTETVKAVDKIVGPGNKYVTAAKKLVFGTVGIDFIAGPTELLIIADESANPEFIAADLLGQAEHDIVAVPILITNSTELANQVNRYIELQLKTLKTAKIAKQSVHNNGITIIVESIEEAVDIANKKAPEHLELQVKNLDDYIKKLTNYGSLFIGHFSAEVLGDYSSGLNHTLPTNGCARYNGGLSVKDFIKIQTTLRTTKEGIQIIGPVARQMGEIEGLDGHAKSVAIRMD